MAILDLLNEESISGVRSDRELVYKFDEKSTVNVRKGESIANISNFLLSTNMYIMHICIYIWTPTPLFYSARAAREG